jgi:hypothetical protein
LTLNFIVQTELVLKKHPRHALKMKTMIVPPSKAATAPMVAISDD